MAVFNTTQFSFGFWLMLGMAGALVVISLLMGIFHKVA